MAASQAPPGLTSEPLKSAFQGADKPAYEDYARCIHCGLCLNHCPTYRLWGLEADSPRGRIRQMMLVDEGRLALGDSFVRHIDQCLDCRACETACPSGVEYGKLVEVARAQIEQNYRRPALSRLARSLAYRHFLPYPNRIAAVARLMRLYQRSGLQTLSRRSGLLRMFGLAEHERLMPPMDDTFFFSQLGRTFPAQGPRRARVAERAGQPMAARWWCPKDSFAAGRWPCTPVCATWRGNSRVRTSMCFCARISTPSSPTPPAAVLR